MCPSTTLCPAESFYPNNRHSRVCYCAVVITHNLTEGEQDVTAGHSECTAVCVGDKLSAKILTLHFHLL